MRTALKIILVLLFSQNIHALIELNGEYGLSTQKYGADRDNTIEATTIGGSVALYLFNYTAIELNYSQTETVTTENNEISIDGTTVDLIGTENNVLVYNYGVGIRQQFADRKARLRPSISLGYARQFMRDSTTAKFRENTSGTLFTITDAVTKLRDDSVFGSFNLELRLTQTIFLRGSVKTIFKAFDFDKAQDNVRYTVGFSWYL